MRLALTTALILAMTAPASAAPSEARVVGITGTTVMLDKGRKAGIKKGRRCAVFVEIKVGSQRRLVQVARCRIASAAGGHATATLSDQQGSVSEGYIVQVKAPRKRRRLSKKGRAANAKAAAAVKTATSKPKQAAEAPDPTPPVAPAEPAKKEPEPEVISGLRLYSHSAFHAAAESWLDDPDGGSEVVYEAHFDAPPVDLGPHEDLSGLAPVQPIFTFPGLWHSCIPRPSSEFCALTIPEDDPAWIRLDAAAYRDARAAIRRGKAKLRLLFTISKVERRAVPEFMHSDCPSGVQSYEPSPDAWAIDVHVVGGTLELKRGGTFLLLTQKPAPSGSLSMEIGFADVESGP